MRKALICALALSGFAATAQAADLGDVSMKDPLPDTIAWHGVTFYGTIDIAGGYESHGAPFSSSLGTGTLYDITGSQMANKATWTLGNSGLEQSKLGIKVEENLGFYGLSAIAQIETGFNPLSGQFSDGCKSLTDNNGKLRGEQNANGDSSRCGQAFNGPVFLGLSSSALGTFTVGRQNTLMLDALAKYDPQNLSYAFSILGYSGFAAGEGDTEDARWNNALKYVYQYGPVHAGAMYTQGYSGLFGPSYGGDIGVDWRGFSIDAVFQQEHGAVSASPIALSATCNAALGVFTSCPTNSLASTISDNTAWSVQAKYTFDLGGWGGYKDGYGGGLKDAVVEGAKLTFYGGYEHVTFTDPRDPVTPGSQTVGGYTLFTTNNFNYATDRVQDISWAGAKYVSGPWSVTGAYYHYSQNSFLNGTAAGAELTCAQQTATAKASTAPSAAGTIRIGTNCAGDLNMGSFVVDYAFTKHFDVYAGVNYSDISGGLSGGYLHDNMGVFMTGARLKF